jgi:hypothetical protein
MKLDAAPESNTIALEVGVENSCPLAEIHSRFDDFIALRSACLSGLRWRLSDIDVATVPTR